MTSKYIFVQKLEIQENDNFKGLRLFAYLKNINIGIKIK